MRSASREGSKDSSMGSSVGGGITIFACANLAHQRYRNLAIHTKTKTATRATNKIKGSSLLIRDTPRVCFESLLKAVIEELTKILHDKAH